MRHPSKLALSFRPSAALKPMSAFRFSVRCFTLNSKSWCSSLLWLYAALGWQEKMKSLYDENTEFLNKYKQQQEKKVIQYHLTSKNLKVEKTTDRLALDKSRRTSRGHLADIWRASGVSNWKAGIWGRDGNWTEHGNGAGLENDWNSSSWLWPVRYEASHKRRLIAKIFNVDILHYFTFLIITELIRNMFDF